MEGKTYFFFFPLQVELKNDAASDIHSVFKSALHLLQEKGFVFQRDGGSDKLYYVRHLQPSLSSWLPLQVQLGLGIVLVSKIVSQSESYLLPFRNGTTSLLL